MTPAFPAREGEAASSMPTKDDAYGAREMSSATNDEAHGVRVSLYTVASLALGLGLVGDSESDRGSKGSDKLCESTGSDALCRSGVKLCVGTRARPSVRSRGMAA